MWKKKDKKKIDLKKKFGSFSFFFSIPILFFATLILWNGLIRAYRLVGIEPKIWPLFLMGFLCSAILLSIAGLQRTKTFIHETKHAVLVVLTGNNLKKFKIGKNTGAVEYEVYEENLHFEPFVLLAPYFLPLFSFPVLLAACLFETELRPQMIFALGLSLGADLTTAQLEIHPNQSDLKRIYGGFLVTRSFLLGAKLCWSSICLLWVIAGVKGFLFAGFEALRFIDRTYQAFFQGV